MRVLMILSVVLMITCFIVNSNREEKIRNAPALYEDIELLVGCAKSQHIKNPDIYLSKLHEGIKSHAIKTLNENCQEELEATRARNLIRSIQPKTNSAPPKVQNGNSKPVSSQAAQSKAEPAPQYENLAHKKAQLPKLSSDGRVEHLVLNFSAENFKK